LSEHLTSVLDEGPMMATTKRIDDQKVKDIAATADEQEGVRQGLADLKKGRVRLAREFFREFEVKHGTSDS
jgi:hypothetical protein